LSALAQQRSHLEERTHADRGTRNLQKLAPVQWLIHLVSYSAGSPTGPFANTPAPVSWIGPKTGARPFEIRFVTGFVTTQAARHRHLSLSQ